MVTTGSDNPEESIEARIERLGRERPVVFASAWHEIGFAFSICMSQVLTVRGKVMRDLVAKADFR